MPQVVQTNDPFATIRQRVDRQLSESLSQVFPWATPRGAAGRQFPAVNIWDAGDELLAEAELPGIKSENLDVSVVGSELTIRGERPDVQEEGVSYHRRERGTGSFTRVVRLPIAIDADRVQANLRDGVLSIRLPKSEAAKPRKIVVQAK
jgi:HSP20 family protein